MNHSLCIGCSACDRVCPWGNAKVILADSRSRVEKCPSGCHLCQRECPTGALELAGRSMTADQVVEEVLRDEPYYRHSGGGMTLSGGEPMAQPDFSLELLSRARSSGIHTAVETSGDGDGRHFRNASSFVDLWIWDIKLLAPEMYSEYVGGSLPRMLSNLEAAIRSGTEVMFRILFIPDLHLDGRVIEATADFLRKFPGVPFEVIPYHRLGNAKRPKLGLREIVFREPYKEEIDLFVRSIS